MTQKLQQLISVTVVESGYDVGNVIPVAIDPKAVGPNDYKLTVRVNYTGKHINRGFIMVYAESKEYHTILKVDHICTIGGDCRLIRESCPGIDCAIEAGSDVTLPLFDVPVSYMVHSEHGLLYKQNWPRSVENKTLS
uniref:MD-2-related lipid-recognition domain-containing protein n=1 Tax=Brassica oleracea var. oleracea TaxID=109376 RepID=A0A0D3BDU6_BRAOL